MWNESDTPPAGVHSRSNPSRSASRRRAGWAPGTEGEPGGPAATLTPRRAVCRTPRAASVPGRRETPVQRQRTSLARHRRPELPRPSSLSAVCIGPAGALDEPEGPHYTWLNIRSEFGGRYVRAVRRPWSSRPFGVAAERPLGSAARRRVRADQGMVVPWLERPRRIAPPCPGSSRTPGASNSEGDDAHARQQDAVICVPVPRSLAYMAVAAVAVPVSLRGAGQHAVVLPDQFHRLMRRTPAQERDKTQPGPETTRGSKRNGII